MHLRSLILLSTSSALGLSAWAQEVEAVPDDVELVIVHGEAKATTDPRSNTVIDGVQLERTRGQDLGEALEGVAGVTLLRTTADATRPMVRGQYGRRVPLLFHGIRLNTQDWGDEHAPELDPFAAASIQVVRGASGVRYGPGAMAGAVLLDPPPLRREDGVAGRLDLVQSTQGQAGTGATRVDIAKGDWSIRLEGNHQRSGALRAPDYVLGNTASATTNGAVTLGWQPGPIYLEAGWRRHVFDSGICLCVRSSTPNELRASLAAGRPPDADLYTPSRTAVRPRQAVTHDLIFAHATVPTSLGTVEVSLDTQLNRREEFDVVRTPSSEPQFDFRLQTSTLHGELHHRPVYLGGAPLTGIVGVETSWQENVLRGLPLVPNHRRFRGGVFALERLTTPAVVLEVGARIDGESRETYLTEDGFDRHGDRGTLTDDDCDDTGSARRCHQTWTASSASAGAVFRLTETLHLRADLSVASRVPDGDELYIFGTSPTLPVLAIGSPALRTERTLGASPTVSWTHGRAHVNVSAFANRVDDYVVFGPLLQNGAPAIETTIRGSFPVFTYRAVNAWFVGLDADWDVTLTPALSVSGTLAMVRAQERQTGALLPFVPADRASVATRFTPGDLGVLTGSSLAAGLTAVSRQNRWDDTTDLGPPPEATVLVGLSAEVPVDLTPQQLVFGVEVRNLLNTAVRSYTSLLRYYADDPGRELRIRAGLHF